MHPVIFASLLLATAPSTPTPGAVAHMVLTDDDPSPALQSPVALTRATAARVAAVRDLKVSLPALRAALDGESDPVARREELRALVLLGDEPDIDRALDVAKNDHGMMIALTDAVARRDDALDLWEKKLQPAGVPLTASFLKQSIWQRPGRLALSGSRFIARHDAAGWTMLLSLLRTARVIMTPGVVAASLNAPSEEMRTRSVWYLVHTFGPDPSKLDPIVRDVLAAPKEEPSLREAFGRELLGRMLGGERKGDPRYVTWLQTTEADDVIRSEQSLFQYFTDEEFFTRKKHCGQATYECRMPATPDRGKSVGMQAVTPPPYMLPGVLPPGLTDAILHETRCSDAWLAIGGATVDATGRVRTADIVKPVTLSAGCEPAVRELMKLSFVTPVSILSPPATQGLILARAARQTPCLDETTVYEEPLVASSSSHITPPKKVKQVEPVFPESVRRSMPPDAYSLVIVQSVISHDGCIRSIQLLAQSPYPQLNTATVESLVQWSFEPGRLDGKPVDVLFNLTVRYKMQ